MERRLERLEERAAAQTDAEGSRAIDELTVRFLDSAANIKASGARGDFEADTLRSESPIVLAAHLLWLLLDEDPREEEARDLLEQVLRDRGVAESESAGALFALVESFVETGRRQRSV